MIFNQSYGSGGGGIYPTIVVTAPTGSTVTCAMGDTTLTATEQSETWTFQIPDLGTWTVTATLDGNTKTSEVLVNKVKTYNVAISFVSTTLNDNDWATIRAVSDAGTGANYWSVGDCKEVTLSGTIGTLALDNYTEYAIIIGFNHNSTLEGDNRIHFQFGMSLSKDRFLALCDDKYRSQVTTTNYFSMNSSESNANGWKDCQMRSNICGTNLDVLSNTFLSVIPDSLRLSMKTVTKYTNNVGYTLSSMTDVITATTDYVFLLGLFEATGYVTNYAANGESTMQKQYAYYSAGNSRAKYKHNDIKQYAFWWTRSPYNQSSSSFVTISTSNAPNNTPSSTRANYSYGFAPAFCV